MAAERSKHGFPLSAMSEITILSYLNHRNIEHKENNIVKLIDVATTEKATQDHYFSS